MTSLMRPSAKPSSGVLSLGSNAMEPASFHDSAFFKVLGRIDEEKSYRASLSNITSQDSSPRSMNSSTDSEVTDWLTSLSPEKISNNYSEKRVQSADSQISFGNNGNTSNEKGGNNLTVVSTVTNIEDPEMKTTASVEHRQDGWSPGLVNSQTPSVSPSNSVSSLQSSLSSSTRDHQQYRRQQQQLQTDDQDAEKLRKDNLALQKECEELELMVLRMKTEGNTLQVRTTLKLKNYRAEIQRATAAKQSIQAQCRELEDKIWNLRTETQLRQEEIWDAEQKLRLQTKQQQQ